MLVPGWVTATWSCSSNAYLVGYEPNAEKQLCLVNLYDCVVQNSGSLHGSILISSLHTKTIQTYWYSLIFIMTVYCTRLGFQCQTKLRFQDLVQEAWKYYMSTAIGKNLLVILLVSVSGLVWKFILISVSIFYSSLVFGNLWNTSQYSVLKMHTFMSKSKLKRTPTMTM